MKKSLIALAALASVAGVAQAQSTATIYGTLDVGAGSFSQQAGSAAKTTQQGLMYNNNDSSRWGILAVEDIGGGIKAQLQAESWIGSLPRNNFGYNSTTNATYGTSSGAATFSTNGVGNSIDATSFGNRILTVGLTMGAHTIQGGQNSAFVRDIAVPYQADGSNVVGNLVGNDYVITGRNVALNYIYAQGPLTAAIGVTSNTKKQDAQADYASGSGYQAKARYAQGAWSVAGAYSNARSNGGATYGTSAATITSTYSATGPSVTSTGTVANPSTQLNSPAATISGITQALTQTKVSVLAADYDLTVAKLFAEYGKVEVTSTDAGSTTNNRHAISVGARVPVGKAWAFVQYSDGKQQASQGGYDGNWTGYSVGARYEFSKRTYAYLVDGQSEYKYNAAGDKLKANQYALGLVHNF